MSNNDQIKPLKQEPVKISNKEWVEQPNYFSLILPFITLVFAVIFIFTPIGIGWNPLTGAPVLMDVKYHSEVINVEGKYFSASSNVYNIMCENGIMYSTSKEIYTNMSTHKTYLVGLKVVNATANMNGYLFKDVTERSVISTTIDSFGREVDKKELV